MKEKQKEFSTFNSIGHIVRLWVCNAFILILFGMQWIIAFQAFKFFTVSVANIGNWIIVTFVVSFLFAD